VIREIERLLAEVPPGEHVGVAHIDLDQFKPVNDRLGHAAGDELLRQVADRLRACARRHDIVGRLGGDEFVVVFADLPRVESLARLVDRLHREVNEPTVVNGAEIMVRASIGAVAAPRGSDADTVLSVADEAMHEAKRGQYVTPCLRTSLPPPQAA
jgi:diguanylate cyclase (GGDEF)-like protein